MESKNNNFFIPRCLEKELKILEDSEFNYSNIHNTFFNFDNDKNKTLGQYRKLIIKEPNIKNDNNKDSDQDLFSIIIPNCSKDFVFKVLKNFQMQLTQKSLEAADEGCKAKKDEVECCHQRKLKQLDSLDNISFNEAPIIQKKYTLMGNLYSKTLSKIFGTNEAPIESSNRPNSVFNKITKINNIDSNCDYFHLELESNKNLSALGKLKSNFVNQTKNYDLFRFFYEKSPNANSNINKKKHFDSYSISNNNNNLINDSESQNLQSQIISQNNDDTTDDGNNLNSRQIQANNFYQSKSAMNDSNKLADAKNPNFSLIFFKFISRENKRNYFNFNVPFAKQDNMHSEEEFVLVVSLVESMKPTNNDTNFVSLCNPKNSEEKTINEFKSKTINIIESNSDPKNIDNNNNNSNNNCLFKIYTKVNFCILTKAQLEKIEFYSSDKQTKNRLLEEFFKENAKISLFNEIIENMKAFILSKTKCYFGNTNSSKEEEESILQAFISLEQNFKTQNNNPEYFSNKRINPAINNQDEMKLDLIDINFCKSNQGYSSNRSKESDISLIDFEQLESNWIVDFNEELNNDFRFENDAEYPSIKRMQVLDLKKHNYYETYLEMLKQLQDILKADPLQIFGENELIRHIYGWRGDLDGCRESLLVMLDWRKTTKPESYTYEADFAIYREIPFKALLNIACEDIYGRPVLKFSPALMNPKALSVDLLCKYLVYILESSCDVMRSYLDKFILFVDLKDVGYSNVSTEHLKKVNEFTRKYYVERLAKIYIINKGFFFGVVWSIVSKFMDDRIHKKLVVVDKSHKASLEYLLGDNYNKIGIHL